MQAEDGVEKGFVRHWVFLTVDNISEEQFSVKSLRICCMSCFVVGSQRNTGCSGTAEEQHVKLPSL